MLYALRKLWALDWREDLSRLLQRRLWLRLLDLLLLRHAFVIAVFVFGLGIHVGWLWWWSSWGKGGGSARGELCVCAVIVVGPQATLGSNRTRKMADVDSGKFAGQWRGQSGTLFFRPPKLYKTFS